MVRGYAHLAANHLAPYAERLCKANREGRNPRHVYGTDLKEKRLASLQAVDLLVAGTGFEPVTFGL